MAAARYIYGLLEINMSAKKQIFRSDCPAEYEENLGYFKIYTDIYINGNKLNGKVNNEAGGTSLIDRSCKAVTRVGNDWTMDLME